MSNYVFPTPSGLNWDIKKTSEAAYLNQPSATPGYSTRLLLGSDLIYHFGCNFGYLRSFNDAGKSPYQNMTDELRLMEDFWWARNGGFDSFLLDLSTLTKNPADATVVDQVLVPDANYIAPIQVTRQSYSENIYELQGSYASPVLPAIISMGGVPMTYGVDYTIVGPGYTMGTVSYPGLAVAISKIITGVITASFSWYYRVRFEQNKQDFEAFMYLLWKMQQVQLVVTRT